MHMPDTSGLMGILSFAGILYLIFRIAIVIFLIYLGVKILQIPSRLKRIEQLLEENLRYQDWQKDDDHRRKNR